MITQRPRGQRKTKDPCPRCGLHRTLCICAQIPALTVATQVCLVIHAKELKRTTNTGRLATMALTNSQLLIRGRDTQPLDLSSLISDEYHTLFFYPSEDAQDLATEIHRLKTADPRPVRLIVPDGNWRQASKVHTRHPELKNVPRVMIKTANTATYHLRAETTAEGMATLQAIAEALGILEGAEVRNALLELYNAKLRATLIGRGVLTTDQSDF